LRVNISYSIDVEEIPTEVDRMLEESKEIFLSATNDLERTIGRNPLEVIENIQDIRKFLVNIDQRLADCSAILSGYIDIIKPSAQPQVPENTDE
tara:strand:- start:1806 stop:2087 length:282 start_codon:yes stop_codon:yes gene_type:complete